MSNARQPKLKTSLRVWAVVCLGAWILASTVCSTEFLFGHSHEGGGHSHEHPAQQDHHHDATASDGTSDHSQDSDNKGNDGHSCCSTLKAIPQAASRFVLPKPDFGQLAPLHFILLAQALTLLQADASPPRQAKHREWAFTPEVCLGPAFRAHAPPLFV